MSDASCRTAPAPATLSWKDHDQTRCGGWHDKYPGVRVHHDIIHGHPGRVLASYSARADLVVLGRHGHPTDVGPGIGSIQHAVLDHAHGSVAVVPCGRNAIEAIRAEPHGIPSHTYD